jgi:D-alanyl-D-alanine carboxypeptidase
VTRTANNPAREGPAAEAAAKGARATEARPTNPESAALATYSVASYGKPVTWPATSATAAGAATAATTASAPPASSLADATAAVSAAKAAPLPTDPIRPIQVKTVKVKLPSTPIVSLAPPLGAPAQQQIATLEAPQAAAPPQVAAEPQPAPKLALQKAGILGVLPSREPAPAPVETGRETVREAAHETAPPQSAAPQGAPNSATPSSTAVHSGWVIQVGAFDAESDARQKLSAVQAEVAQILGHASPFTETVVKGDKTLYRARFAGLQKDEAEAVCRQLKRGETDCMIIKN